jgi:hypothetical protein
MASLASTPAAIAVPHRPRYAPRGVGLIVGLGVGGLFASLGAAFTFVDVLGLDGLPWLAPTIVTGAVVGWLFGPRAWRAEGFGSWFWIVLGQALVAVVVGAIAVVVDGFVLAAIVEGANVGDVAGAVLGSVLLVIYGLVLVGWTVAPFTFLAAMVWAALMRASRHGLGVRLEAT